MSDAGQQPPNFPIATFVQNNFQPTSVFATTLEFDVCNAGFALGEIHASSKRFQCCRDGCPLHLNEIGFFDSKPRMGQLIGQVSIVGDENQALARLIEAAHVINTLIGFDQVNDADATGWVFAG